MRSRLQRDVKVSLCPDGPNLLVQKVPGLFGIQREIKVPKDFGEHNPQFSICKVASDAVSHTDRPGLECGVIVLREHPFALIEMALGNKLVRLSEVILGKVGA